MGYGVIRLVAAVLLSAFATYSVHAGPGSQTVFQMYDVAGDDRGDGSLSYPQDKAFHPYKDLLDLTLFAVVEDSDGVYFDFGLGAVANPWDAPEGFFHPRIDLYIHAGLPGGRLQPLRSDPALQFDRRFPWHYWIRIAPFGGTALFHWQDDPGSTGQQRGVTVTTRNYPALIRVSISRDLLPSPSKSWRYYVLVGSFDGFGADGYRGVGPPTSQWLLGSPNPQSSLPIVDLLAPRWGPHTQGRQLKITGHGETKVHLYPVGGFSLYRISFGIVVITLTVCLVALVALGRVFGSRSRIVR